MKANKEEIIEDLNKTKDVVILADTEGGKRLTEGLVTDIVADIEKLVNDRYTLSQNDFVTIACDVKAKLDIVRVLKRAKANEKFLKELLEEALAL